MARPPKQRLNRMRRLSTMIDPLIEPALLKRGFAINKLVSHWPQIVGDIAEWCRPAGLSFPRDSQREGTLKLQIASGRGPQAQAMSGDIITQVNTAFGYQAITRITLVQTMAAPNTASPPYRPTQISDAPDIWTLDEKLQSVRSAPLRAALRRLGGPVDDSD
jgi:hypothetical protein